MPRNNSHGDPTKHLAAAVQAALAAEASKKPKSPPPKPRYHGGGPAPKRRAKPMTRRKSLWKQLQSFFTRKRK